MTLARLTKNRILRDAAGDFAVAKNRHTMQAFASAFAGATVLVPTEKNPLLENKAEIVFMHDEKGRPLLVAFTDEEIMQAWEYRPLIPEPFSSNDVLSIVLDGEYVGLVIDPGAPSVIFLERSAVRLLSDGYLPSIPEATPINVGLQILPMAAQLPPHLLALLQTSLAAHSNIEAGYLFELAEEGAPVKKILGIHFNRCSMTKRQATIRQLQEIVRLHTVEPETIRVRALDDVLLGPVQRAIVPSFAKPVLF